MRRDGLDFSHPLQQAMVGLCENLVATRRYREAGDSLVVITRLALQAIRHNFAGMSETERLKYRNGLARIFDLVYTCLCRPEEGNKEIFTQSFKLELQQKELVLNSQLALMRQMRNSLDPAVRHAYIDWLGNRQMLSGQYALPYNQRQWSIDSLELLNEMLEKKLTLMGFQTPLSVDSVPRFSIAGLYDSQAAVAFVRFHDRVAAGAVRYAAFVFRKGDAALTFVPLCRETALIALETDGGKKSVTDNERTRRLYDFNSPWALELYRLIWLPLQPALRNIRDIRYCTAGLLNDIAFQALYNGKKYLFDTYKLRRCLSLSDSSPQLSLPQSSSAIGFWGNIDYNLASNAILPSSDPPAVPSGERSMESKDIRLGSDDQVHLHRALPSLQTPEAARIKKLFTRHHLSFTSFEGALATEENFKEQAPSTMGILHIFTHGFYSPFDTRGDTSAFPDQFMSALVNPSLRCGLAFAGANYYWLNGKPNAGHDDGILTGYEIEALDLHRVQLVVLAACETGLGDLTDNEGNLGLERAFKLAGAGQLLVSLWRIPARQTSELLYWFYCALLDQKTPNEALLEAQRRLQKKYPPYYWAGFALIE